VQHRYEQRRVSTIGQEKARKPRVGGDRTLEEFVKLMGDLKLAYPKFIDYAVPGNRGCGVCPPGVPEHLQQYCMPTAGTRQG
ncbi:MAG TPA: MBL fold metallo-hydrolase, partial [Thiobacillus sp.]